MDQILYGLAVIGLAGILKIITQKIVIPQFQHYTYQGTQLEGKWLTELGDQTDKIYTEEVIMKRSGYNITGKITVKKCPGADVGKVYDFNGIIKNDFVIGTYHINDKSKFDSGNFCLAIRDGCNMLDGYSLSYYDPDHKIKCLQYKWKKQ